MAVSASDFKNFVIKMAEKVEIFDHSKTFQQILQA